MGSKSRYKYIYVNKPRMLEMDEGSRIDLNSVIGFQPREPLSIAFFMTGSQEELIRTFDSEEEQDSYMDALDRYYKTISIDGDTDDDD